jgi:hypothetical protein
MVVSRVFDTRQHAPAFSEYVLDERKLRFEGMRVRWQRRRMTQLRQGLR